MTDENGDGNGGTTEASYRWKSLSSVVTVLVTLSYIGLVLAQQAGVAGGVDNGTWSAFTLAFLAVIAYSVGIDTFKEVAKLRGGGD